MKYAIIALMCLTGCSGLKARKFICVTPFGMGTFESVDPKLKVNGDYLEIKGDESVSVIPRAMCLETRE